MESDADIVVDISSCVLFLCFLLIDDPGLVVYHVLVVELTTGQVQRSEPLVSQMIKLELVAFLPVVEATADLDDLVPWTPVVHSERMGRSDFPEAVKLTRHDRASIKWLTTLLSPEINIIELELV